MTEIKPPEPTDIRPITNDKVEVKWEDVEKIFGDIRETILDMAEKVGRIIGDFINSLEPYMVYEMLHPKKKPRGSIRRAKRAKKRGDAE